MDVRLNDRVSLSRVQVSEVEVLSAPPAPTTFALTLPTPVNGGTRTFEAAAAPGDTVAQIAERLQQQLTDLQTPYVVERVAGVLVLVGPIGFSFDPVVTPTYMTSRLVTPAVSWTGPTGDRQIGVCKVIDCNDSPVGSPRGSAIVGRRRRYYTRDRAGVVSFRWDVLIQEENTSNFYEVQVDQILTLIETAPF